MGANCVRNAGWCTNEVDLCVAPSIRLLLPNFITPSATVELAFYNSYLQVPIDRVFTSARGYRVRWTRDDCQNILAFVVRGKGVCSNTTFAIGEFAPPFATFEEQQNTLVTLGTKMKAALNKLKSLGGGKSQNLWHMGQWRQNNDNVMDLPVTELHRMTPVCTCSNIGKATLAAAEKVLKDH
ncbi:hypothetical protein BC940DRAFT_330500 [Gongronella butleri]|nr:hypothetical protein BC940DRAFT_330500 [Gongronella butleri]